MRDELKMDSVTSIKEKSGGRQMGMALEDAPASAEEELFDALIESRDTVFRICLGFCHNACDAEDLTHDVYVTAYQKLGMLKKSEAGRSWLYKITRNTCLNHLRRSVRPPLMPLTEYTLPDRAESPERSAELREQLEFLRSVVAMLPRKMREVFVLREYGHLAYEEIAGALGIRCGTVMSRLDRARRFVAGKMRNLNHE